MRQTVLKAGARVVEHARRLIVEVAQAAGVPWARLLQRMEGWWRPSVSPAGLRSAVRVWGRTPPRPRRWVPPPRHAHLCLVLRE